MLSEIGEGRIPAGMEVWDLYDVNRQKTGETCFRGCTLPDGRFHLVVNVCVFNDQGAMLIQQRQSSKVPYPDLWTLSSGGCAIAGETSAMAASRELQEEIGITSDFTGQRPLLTISGTNSFSDYYLLRANPDLYTLSLQSEEVQAVRWATLDDILRLLRLGQFVPYHQSLISLLFDMEREGPGATVRMRL